MARAYRADFVENNYDKKGILVRPVSRDLVKNGGQRNHEPAIDAIMPVVADELERLDVSFQMPLAHAAVFFQPPFEQAYPTLAVVGVDLIVLT